MKFELLWRVNDCITYLYSCFQAKVYPLDVHIWYGNRRAIRNVAYFVFYPELKESFDYSEAVGDGVDYWEEYGYPYASMEYWLEEEVRRGEEKQEHLHLCGGWYD